MKLKGTLAIGVALAALPAFAAEESPAQMLLRQAGFAIGFYYNGPTKIEVGYRTFTAKYQPKLDAACQNDPKCPFEKAVPIIKEMAESLKDPFTTYVSSEQIVDTERFIAGQGPSKPWFGWQVAQINDGLIVLETYPGEPAAKSGVKRGDLITKINGQSAKIDTLNTLNSAKFEINGKMVEISTKIAQASPQPVGQMVGNVYVMRIPNFWSAEIVGNKVHRLVSEAKLNKATGIVIDLRDSDTGYDNEALAVAGAFVPKYQFTYKERFVDREHTFGIENGKGFGKDKDQTPTPQFEIQNPQTTDLPVVVLVNKNTFNTAEMLAYFLQSTKRATIVGEKTAGALSVSGENSELINGGAIQISNMRLYDEKGQVFPLFVTPDIEITDDINQLAKNGYDIVLEKAFEVLKNNQGAQK